jgi:glucose-6-phosphate 1-dehydrogenase
MSTTEQNTTTFPPTALVIFGATGNLSGKKIFPALYRLLELGRLPENFVIIGVVRNSLQKTIFQDLEITLLRQRGSCDQELLSKLRGMTQLIQMDSTVEDDYRALKAMLNDIDTKSGVKHNRLFYLAIPPSIFRTVLVCLAAVGLNMEDDGVAHRILVEKPFGTDLASARDLVATMNAYFTEVQTFRIDHYLAKETAQNILTFRFNNPLIDGIWGRHSIDHIQITSAETNDVADRAAFYEGMGALRDIVQSHLLQLVALTMMEVPFPMTAKNMHAERLLLLRSIAPIKPAHIDELAVRGQYEGYKEHVGNPDSRVETFAALKIEVLNSRWGGVPVLLRTGKALAASFTEINVVFKDRSRRNVPDNLLTLRIQPNEGVTLSMLAKKPGFSSETEPVEMSFRYETSFGEAKQAAAYERVLVDAMQGDQTLFATSNEVLAAWEILQPIIDAWANEDALPPATYPKGSMGPKESDELAREYGTEWLSAVAASEKVESEEE